MSWREIFQCKISIWKWKITINKTNLIREMQRKNNSIISNVKHKILGTLKATGRNEAKHFLNQKD